MKKIKCITFDKEAQNAIPNDIKAKMKADRKKARKGKEIKGGEIHDWDFPVA